MRTITINKHALELLERRQDALQKAAEGRRAAENIYNMAAIQQQQQQDAFADVVRCLADGDFDSQSVESVDFKNAGTPDDPNCVLIIIPKPKPAE